MIKSETVMSRAVRWLCYGKMNRLYPAGIPAPVLERFGKEWKLLQEYGIEYWNKRTHAGRQIGLRLEPRDDA